MITDPAEEAGGDVGAIGNEKMLGIEQGDAKSALIERIYRAPVIEREDFIPGRLLGLFKIILDKRSWWVACFPLRGIPPDVTRKFIR